MAKDMETKDMETKDMDMNDTADSPVASLVRRLWPLALVALAAIAFFGLGLNEKISIDELARNQAALDAQIDAHPLVSHLAAGLLYVLAVAVAFPAAWLITVAYGVLFGWLTGLFVVVISATIGACLLYFIARHLASDFFREKAGPWLNTMAEGFRKDAASYLLFLRLVPLFPFLLVNVVPAILGVRFSTYAWTTAVGIIPGALAYIYAGEGLRSIVAERAVACAAGEPPCGEPLRAADLVTTDVLIAISLLALVSLLPALLKRLRKKDKPAQ